MKRTSLWHLAMVSLLIFSSSFVCSADKAEETKKLDVLNMKEIPGGLYDVQLQLGGKTQTVRLAIAGDRAAYVKSEAANLEGISGRFELIGNGVFMAQLVGKKYRASQWWIFKPDGTALVKEIPNRGEKEVATPVEVK